MSQGQWNAKQVSDCLRFIRELHLNPPEYDCANPIMDASWMCERELLGIDNEVVIAVSRALLFGVFDEPRTVDSDQE